MHILSPETDNCPSWISGRERMTVENISWSISTKECCRPRRGLNPRPPGLQSDGTSNWATEAGNHCKRKWHKYSMYSWKRNRKYFVSKLRKLELKFFHTYKMHFYLLITTWYILTFELSVQFVRHAFHLWFLLIFYDDVYRWHIPPPCLVSRQIILKCPNIYGKQ